MLFLMIWFDPTDFLDVSMVKQPILNLHKLYHVLALRLCSIL